MSGVDYTVPYVLDRERFQDETFCERSEAAIAAHIKGLGKAETHVMFANDLLRILFGYLVDHDDDAIATQVAAIRRRIDKARDRLDEHDTEYRNLFIAYFDQQDKLRNIEKERDIALAVLRRIKREYDLPGFNWRQSAIQSIRKQTSKT